MSLLTLSEVKDHLNIPFSDTSDDSELQNFIDAAESALTERCGPLVPVSVSSRVPGRTMTLNLPVVPVVSLTSITPYGGAALDLSGLYLNEAAGTVVYVDGYTAFWDFVYTVDYQAGRASCPSDLLLAVKELVRHLWATQRGNQPLYAGALPEDGGESFATISGVSFALPRRVEQLIEPHVQVHI